jgi:poly(3-hydroxybutyrate) depolymerase
MATTSLHLNTRGAQRRHGYGARSVVTLLTVILIGCGATDSTVTPSAAGDARAAALDTRDRHPRPRRVGSPQVITITYTAHNGAPRDATVLLPASYKPGNNPPIPLVISPHGRGATGLSNSKFWGRLPTSGNFAVVSPDGMGRQLKNFSYGYAGQIDDLARMPQIVSHALPWVQLDRDRIYALGSSMGGQETLLLVARHPELLAGAAAMDSVTDLTRRYEQVLQIPSSREFIERWGAPKGVCTQSAMRREVGGTPDAAPRRYKARSPLSQARSIAGSGVPLQIWWSKTDKIVFDQEHQSQALFDELRRLGTHAPLISYTGRWAHSKEMRATALLPLALIDFGLLPRGFRSVPKTVRRVSVAS